MADADPTPDFAAGAVKPLKRRFIASAPAPVVVDPWFYKLAATELFGEGVLEHDKILVEPAVFYELRDLHHELKTPRRASAPHHERIRESRRWAALNRSGAAAVHDGDGGADAGAH